MIPVFCAARQLSEYWLTIFHISLPSLACKEVQWLLRFHQHRSLSSPNLALRKQATVKRKRLWINSSYADPSVHARPPQGLNGHPPGPRVNPHPSIRVRSSLGVEETVEIAKSVAAALSFTHSHGVIHRDKR